MKSLTTLTMFAILTLAISSAKAVTPGFYVNYHEGEPVAYSLVVLGPPNGQQYAVISEVQPSDEKIPTFFKLIAEQSRTGNSPESGALKVTRVGNVGADFVSYSAPFTKAIRLDLVHRNGQQHRFILSNP